MTKMISANLAQTYNAALSVTTLVLVCPSFRKKCGIGRYTLQLAIALKPYFAAVELCETVLEAGQKEDVVAGRGLVLFQHEYSLVDFHSALAASETTSDVISSLKAISAYGSKVGIVMHTVVVDHVGPALANTQILSGQIPVFATTRDGAASLQVNYLDLGIPLNQVREAINKASVAAGKDTKENGRLVVSVADDIPPNYFRFIFYQVYESMRRVLFRSIKYSKESVREDVETTGEVRVGAFGFLSDNKDVESVLQLCARSGAAIHANFASTDQDRCNVVLARAQELEVKGKISFDFLDDQKLIEFLMPTTVIYLPQHDFDHFSTSATARLGLALGKLVIVPPHRAFHDLASGVQFADLHHAVSILKGLEHLPERLAELRRPGELLAQGTEMGMIYADVASRILRDDVWCGGAISKTAAIRDELGAMNKRQALLAALSPINRNSIARVGFGFVQGELVELDYLSRQEGGEFELQPKPGFENVLKTEDSFRALMGCDPIANWIRESTLTGVSACQLRALRGLTSTYISVLEIMGLPTFCQALFMVKELRLPVEAVAEYFAKMGVKRDSEAGHEFVTPDLVDRVDTFRSLVSAISSCRSPLIWGRPVIPMPTDVRQFIFPESIVAHNEGESIQALYGLLLHRKPDKAGFYHYLDRLRGGSTKSEVAWDIVASPEARACGVKLAYNRAYWAAAEDFVQQRLNLYAAMRPKAETTKDRNISYIQQVTIDRALAAL